MWVGKTHWNETQTTWKWSQNCELIGFPPRVESIKTPGKDKQFMNYKFIVSGWPAVVGSVSGSRPGPRNLDEAFRGSFPAVDKLVQFSWKLRLIWLKLSVHARPNSRLRIWHCELHIFVCLHVWLCTLIVCFFTRSFARLNIFQSENLLVKFSFIQTQKTSFLCLKTHRHTHELLMYRNFVASRWETKRNLA